MKHSLTKLPSQSGVYIFRDQQDKVLYIGKAINLKNRVQSYFQKGFELGPKTTAMVEKIAKIEHIVVESELEALLLEIDLIKRLKPKYNVRWRDDKAYKYIKIQSAKCKVQSCNSKLKVEEVRPDYFAKVTSSRSLGDKNAKYFGPFPEGKTVNQVLRTLRRIFPFRDCAEAKFRRYQKLGRPCLYGDLNLCPAPCVGRISPKDYQKIIRQLKSFLSGKSKKIIQELEKEMKSYSKNKEFEKAAAIRDRIRNYRYITQDFRRAEEYLEHPDLLEDRRKKEIEELRRELKFATTCNRIEAYDISNIFGQWAVGSLVVFVNGEPSKKDYRRFKIKTVKKISDVEMIKEVLQRRFNKSQLSTPNFHLTHPDLILIDGGKPQVSAANEVLKELDIKTPVLGLAKKEEVIITSRLSSLHLNSDSPALHLLQRIRDEAHRSAVLHHRKLRSKVLK